MGWYYDDDDAWLDAYDADEIASAFDADAVAHANADERERAERERERMTRPHPRTWGCAPCRMCLNADGTPWVEME